MDAAQALVTICTYAVAGRLVYTKHAAERMDKRNVSRGDVRRALSNAASCSACDSAGKWKAYGPDLGGDDLDVVLVVEAGQIVVTVY